MRRYTLLFLIVFVLQGYSQNGNLINIHFQNENLFQVLDKLKTTTDKQFFYDTNWLSSDKKITKNYLDKDLDFILTDVLNDFNINYIIMGNKVILTNKNRINTNLPEVLFKKDDSVKKENKKDIPLYLKEYEKDENVIVIGNQKQQHKKYYLLKGNVKSISKNKPIKGLKVYLKGKNYSTLTDTYGNYILKVPFGYHELKTKKFNYMDFSQHILVYGDGTLNLNIFDDAENLNEVVVTGKIHNNVKQVEIGVTKIKAISAKITPMVLGERDLLKIATTMPGVKTAGEGSLGYNIRGGKVDQNLILLDNATIYNPSHFFGVFSAINPFSTKSVTIYKGGLPSEFGGRLSSVIDIKTKKVSSDKFKGEGNIGIITSNLMLETPIIKDKLAVLTGFRTTYSDWILKSVNEESIKNSSAAFLDGIVKIDGKINNKNILNTTFYYSKDNFSISSDSVYQYQNKLASLEWKHIFNKNNSFSLQSNNTIYDFNIINDGPFNTNFDIHFAIKENQIKFKMLSKLNDKHKLTYGLSSKLYNLAPGEIKPFDNNSIIQYKKIQNEKGIESGVFISDKFKLTDKLIVDLGFRYSLYAFLGEANQNIYASNQPHIEENIVEVKHYKNNEVVKTYSEPEIRLMARYAFNNDLSIKASFNNTIQYIHLLSSNTTASPVDTWTLSNLNLKPQRSSQVSFGIFKNLNNQKYEISLEAYYKKMQNILEYKIGADLLLSENIEKDVLPGIGKSYGIELLVKKNTGRFNGWFSYSYSRSLVKVDGQLFVDKINNGKFYPANYDKPHDLSLIMNYKLTKRYSFSMNFVYQTGRPITYPIGRYQYGGIENVLYSDRNEFRIPDYYRLDLGVNIEGNHKIKKLAHSFWNISVYNVLGRKNPYSIYFVNENGNIQGYKTSIFGAPIPSISYNFKF